MPCTHYGPGEVASFEAKVSTNRLRKVNELTALLCSTCKYLEKSDVEFPEDLKLWWEAHQEKDAARKKAEDLKRKQRREALAKELASKQEAIDKIQKELSYLNNEDDD